MSGGSSIPDQADQAGTKEGVHTLFGRDVPLTPDCDFVFGDREKDGVRWGDVLC